MWYRIFCCTAPWTVFCWAFLLLLTRKKASRSFLNIGWRGFCWSFLKIWSGWLHFFCASVFPQEVERIKAKLLCSTFIICVLHSSTSLYMIKSNLKNWSIVSEKVVVECKLAMLKLVPWSRKRDHSSKFSFKYTSLFSHYFFN